MTQCMGAIHQAANGDFKAKDIVAKADDYYGQKRQQVKDLRSLALLDGLIPPMLQYKDTTVERLEVLLAPPAPPKPPVERQGGGTGPAPVTPPQPKKIIKQYNRQIVFPAKRLESETDVDAYVEKIRDQLKQLLKNCDGIQLK